MIDFFNKSYQENKAINVKKKNLMKKKSTLKLNQSKKKKKKSMVLSIKLWIFCI